MGSSSGHDLDEVAVRVPFGDPAAKRFGAEDDLEPSKPIATGRATHHAEERIRGQLPLDARVQSAARAEVERARVFIGDAGACPHVQARRGRIFTGRDQGGGRWGSGQGQVQALRLLIGQRARDAAILHRREHVVEGFLPADVQQFAARRAHPRANLRLPDRRLQREARRALRDEQGPRRDVPSDGPPVQADRQQVFPIRREGHIGDGVLMVEDHEGRAAAIPQAGGAAAAQEKDVRVVIHAGQQVLAGGVAAPLDAAHGQGVPSERALQRVILQFPHADVVVIARDGQQVAPDIEGGHGQILAVGVGQRAEEGQLGAVAIEHANQVDTGRVVHGDDAHLLAIVEDIADRAAVVWQCGALADGAVRGEDPQLSGIPSGEGRHLLARSPAQQGVSAEGDGQALALARAHRPPQLQLIVAAHRGHHKRAVGPCGQGDEACCAAAVGADEKGLGAVERDGACHPFGLGRGAEEVVGGQDQGRGAVEGVVF